MKKRPYIAPEIQIISVAVEPMMALSTEHTPGVQDQWEDENSDEEAPFGFAKRNNWFYEEEEDE